MFYVELLGLKKGPGDIGKTREAFQRNLTPCSELQGNAANIYYITLFILITIILFFILCL